MIPSKKNKRRKVPLLSYNIHNTTEVLGPIDGHVERKMLEPKLSGPVSGQENRRHSDSSRPPWCFFIGMWSLRMGQITILSVCLACKFMERSWDDDFFFVFCFSNDTRERVTIYGCTPVQFVYKPASTPDRIGASSLELHRHLLGSR